MGGLAQLRMTGRPFKGSHRCEGPNDQGTVTWQNVLVPIVGKIAAENFETRGENNCPKTEILH